MPCRTDVKGMVCGCKVTIIFITNNEKPKSYFFLPSNVALPSDHGIYAVGLELGDATRDRLLRGSRHWQLVGIVDRTALLMLSLAYVVIG